MRVDAHFEIRVVLDDDVAVTDRTVILNRAQATDLMVSIQRELRRTPHVKERKAVQKRSARTSTTPKKSTASARKPRVTLTAGDIEAVKARHASGTPPLDIAKEYHVSKSTVVRVLAGKYTKIKKEAA